MHSQLTTVHLKGHHLSATERGQIAAYHEIGKSNRSIAAMLGVCPQAINNELKRGLVQQVKKVNGKVIYFDEYCPDTAQQRYSENRIHSHRSSKFHQEAPFLADYIKHFQEDGWSPDAFIGRMVLEGGYRPNERVSTTTLYHYIDDQRLEVRNIDLTEKTRRRNPHHKTTKVKRLRGRSIDERPAAVASRQEFGHFEIDTIVGLRNGRESVIMALIERQSRFEIMRLLDGRDADSMAYALREGYLWSRDSIHYSR